MCSVKDSFYAALETVSISYDEYRLDSQNINVSKKSLWAAWDGFVHVHLKIVP